jgi:hypothetical protein
VQQGHGANGNTNGTNSKVKLLFAATLSIMALSTGFVALYLWATGHSVPSELNDLLGRLVFLVAGASGALYYLKQNRSKE